MEAPDLLVRNAARRGRPGRWMLAARDGRISLLTEDDHDPGPAAGMTIDADGALITEPFVDAHLHLCKAGTLELAGSSALEDYTTGAMGAAMSAIHTAAVVKHGQTVEAVLARARPVLLESVRHGVRAVQAFADVDAKAQLTGIDALLALRREFAGLIDVQVVAFPQDGLLREPVTEELLVEAVRRGADVVGGIPWIEWTDADAERHVNSVVELARRHGRRVAMLVDDAAHLLDARTDAALEKLYDMVTVTAARVIGRPAAHLMAGAPADFVILDSRTVREALTRHSPPRHVVVAGKIVASTTSHTTFGDAVPRM
ncbi:amidohydrolase family protein [Nonomuraea sp. NPDC048916]|uniref:amidohydrolase family protein n=1 Tax=Nonomuraea sp. NPDC048916 TaxID=3154232 RepID=UPI0033F6951A